jgi:hypothetical protein
MAVITGFYLLALEPGSSIAGAVAGAVQKQPYGELNLFLGPLFNSTIIDTIYAQRSTAAAKVPLGSAVRTGAIMAWDENMHHILIGAVSVAAANVILCALLADRKLTNSQNSVDGERASIPLPISMLRPGGPRIRQA